MLECVGRLTPRQRDAVESDIRTGSVAAAAHRMGIAERTLAHHLADARTRTGTQCVAQTAYVLARRGEIAVPELD